MDVFVQREIKDPSRYMEAYNDYLKDWPPENMAVTLWSFIAPLEFHPAIYNTLIFVAVPFSSFLSVNL